MAERRSSKLVEIASNIFGIINAENDSVSGGFGANQGFIVLEDSVLVFDSGISPSIAQNLDNMVQKITDKRVRYLVNSHAHDSHALGNSFFSKKYFRNGLEIISHKNCFERARTEVLISSKESKADLRKLQRKQRRVSSIQYYGDSLHLSVEGTELILIHPENGAHTLGDTILFVPEKNTIFAGDIFYNSFFPNLEDAHIDSWLDTLSSIDSKTYTKFLPGHGEVGGKKELQNFSEYLKQVRDKLLAVDLNEASQKEIRSCLELEGTEDWKLKTVVDRNVRVLTGNSLGT